MLDPAWCTKLAILPWDIWLSSSETAALVFVTTITLLLIIISRAERFACILSDGHETVAADERLRASAITYNYYPAEDSIAVPGIAGASAANISAGSGLLEVADASDKATRWRLQTPPTSSSRVGQKLVSVMRFLAATFCVFIWSRHIEAGEYLPIPCRGWHIGVFVFQCM